VIRTGPPHIPGRVSGYNLDALLPENGFHVARALVGTESTCALVLEATARLVPSPPKRTLVVLGYGGEGLLPDGNAWLLAEFGGQTQEDADAKGRKLVAALDSGRTHPATSCTTIRTRRQRSGRSASIPQPSVGSL
jgi:hypothetical protein